MPTAFSRTLNTEALDADENLLDETRAQIRSHLSMVTSEDEDEDLYADEVTIQEEQVEGGVWVCGTIDREPVATYLREDFDPDTEARANPLSVPSQFDEPSTVDGEPS